MEHEHEDIRAHVVAADEAIAMISDGRINNAAAIIALQWLQLNRSRLRAGRGSHDRMGHEAEALRAGSAPSGRVV